MDARSSNPRTGSYRPSTAPVGSGGPAARHPKEMVECERQGRRGRAPRSDDEAVVKELAIGQRSRATEEAALRKATGRQSIPVEPGKVLRMVGRSGFRRPGLSDARPRREPSVEAALGPEEVHRMYGFVTTLGAQGDAGSARAPAGRDERLLARDTVHPQHLREVGRHRGHGVDRARAVRSPGAGALGGASGKWEDRPGAERRVCLLPQASEPRAIRTWGRLSWEVVLPNGQRP